MSTVLQLQKLVPAGQGEESLPFVSTYSSICPTNGAPENGTHFEMQ